MTKPLKSQNYDSGNVPDESVFNLSYISEQRAVLEKLLPVPCFLSWNKLPKLVSLVCGKRRENGGSTNEKRDERRTSAE